MDKIKVTDVIKLDDPDTKSEIKITYSRGDDFSCENNTLNKAIIEEIYKDAEKKRFRDFWKDTRFFSPPVDFKTKLCITQENELKLLYWDGRLEKWRHRESNKLFGEVVPDLFLRNLEYSKIKYYLDIETPECI